MSGDWLSIVPFLVVIPLAIFTKKVLPALVVGVVVGGYLVQPQPVGGLKAAVQYVVNALIDENNIKVILFLYAFTGLVGMMKHSGGIKGFVKWASDTIETKRGAIGLTWVSTLGTFAAPSFRIVTVAPIMRSLLHRIKMTPQELGFVIETTCTSIVSLIPISTAFVGYMVSVTNMALKNENINADGYSMFLRSIPFNFFSLAIILIGIYLSFFHKSKKDVEKNAEPENKEQAEAKGYEDCHPAVSKDLPAKPFNLIVPLFLVIFLTIGLTYYNGVRKGFSGFNAFIEADVLDAMLVSLVTGILFAFVFYLFQQFKLQDLMDEFISGANGLMQVVILLSVVWGLSLAANDLGFADFVSSHISWIPDALVPPVMFVLGSFIAYFIGSAFGTWGILMPLGVSMAAMADASLPVVIGAVFASGAFGAFASPLSDDTNTMAGILDLKAVSYSRFKLKPGLIAAGVATVGYGVTAFII
ncbi:Na+/H+ antiporter NhaC family protein [Tuberibacillus sp. Marseille-P3662]|uniref:Na+/H+ antiporter NhaC family protein n=1 Tax=Tuberibacillus sp. Marseille-P3662 TaxID=1965358 RepID=UPI000A1CB44F|nr:Na+/H+ antiporter NhaC family protein [Tuberibacillus sp. Marseille-P3662]